MDWASDPDYEEFREVEAQVMYIALFLTGHHLSWGSLYA